MIYGRKEPSNDETLVAFAKIHHKYKRVTVEQLHASLARQSPDSVLYSDNECTQFVARIRFGYVGTPQKNTKKIVLNGVQHDFKWSTIPHPAMMKKVKA